MRISDWSSDVCSSDLPDPVADHDVIQRAVDRLEESPSVTLALGVGQFCACRIEPSVRQRVVPRQHLKVRNHHDRLLAKRCGLSWSYRGAAVIFMRGSFEDRKSTRLNSSH